MRNVRFGIDIDGTVTCPTSLLPHINEQYKTNLVLDDIKEYDLTKAVNIDKKEFFDWYKTAEERIYQMSPPQRYARNILEHWKSQFELFYISARGKNVYETTKEWFHKENIPYDHIELIGSHYKIETARKYNVDAFFEDKHDNAVDISEELNIPVILFDTPYNRKAVPDSVIRVYDWNEANVWIDRLFPTNSSI